MAAAVIGLFILAVFYTSFFAAALLVPLIFSVLLAFLLAPAVLTAEKVGIARLVSASMLVALIVGCVLFGVYALATPAAGLLREAPTSIEDVSEKFRGLQTPLANVREAAEAVQEAVQDISGQSDDEQVVAVRDSGWLELVVGKVPYLAGAFAIAMVFTIFLLAWADEIIASLAALRRDHGFRRRTLVTIYRLQRDVARYLVTVTLINAVLGIVVWLAMLGAAMPNAALWGTVAGVANFAPYIGPACTAAALLLAGASVFETWQAALVPVALFVLITSIEGQLITPTVLGHRLSLPPPLVFLGVLVLGWLWGIAGALIAVPLLIIVNRLWHLGVDRRRSAWRLLGSGYHAPGRSRLTANVVRLTPD